MSVAVTRKTHNTVIGQNMLFRHLLNIPREARKGPNVQTSDVGFPGTSPTISQRARLSVVMLWTAQGPAVRI